VGALLGPVIALAAVALAAALALPAELSPAAALALAVLTAAGVRRLSAPRALVVAIEALLVALAALVTSGFTSAGIPLIPALNTTAWVVAVASGMVLRSFDDRSAAVAAGVRRQVELDLARELHDVVAHHITGIIVQAQAGQLVAARDPAIAEATFRDIEQQGSASLTAIRRTLGLLRDSTVDSLPSCDEDDVRRLAARVLGPDGPALHLRVEPRSQPWPALVEATAYRIVQESLTNAARHALDATQVVVAIEQVKDVVQVLVEDDGIPVHAQPERHGLGLLGMAERAEIAGGSLTAGPAPEAGWRVRAYLPIHREPRQ
jgi:signal transduction histidine kinase